MILERVLVFSCMFLDTEMAHLFCEALWLAGELLIQAHFCRVRDILVQHPEMFLI